MIHRVIVHQRGEVNQLQRRGKRDSLLLRLLRSFAGEQQQCRTEHLAAHRQQMRAHLTDQRQIAGDDLGHRVRYTLQLVLDRELNRLEGGSARCCYAHAVSVFGGRRSHFAAALVICFRRLLTSRKSISMAKTR